ncbi:DUF1690 domain-containing protein [Metarhizium rileyi]|uniref:DUF1690 domain-containing protein n=1 Tax=Metarhizium rileyi (strain RCEF 4871) TaxID=1649241 RepID=A0A167GTY7_METRR|nr:DUF1690 domain-containing protein [Metarhizium rileyi RCEF 4871]TWU75108.1 hypothetical protein ED733_001262 [Metarhizium rileyi]
MPEISRSAAERDHELPLNHCRSAIELDNMGASASKQEASGHYEWKASGPPSVSLEVLDTLKSSPETDASRARLIEQHVQARVAEELKKLQKKESEALNVAHEKIASAENSDESKLSRFTLGQEVDELRRKLGERKKVRELPEAVENSRSAVIRCLREHDRRPLDCWQEVEDFKAEVKKLEKSWVDKITS